MAERPKSSSPSPRKKLEDTAAAFASIASTLSDTIERFDRWLNTLKGKSEVTIWGEQPTDDVDRLGLWVRRRDKHWEVAYRALTKTRNLRLTAQELEARKRNSSAHFANLTEQMLANYSRPSKELLEAEVWEPLSTAPLAIKVAATPMLPKLIDAMHQAQAAQVAKIKAAMAEIDHLIGDDQGEGR